MNIFNSDLDHEHFNNEFFNHLGLCSHSIEELRVQNSSLENITVGHQMTELQILDLRQNEAVDTLNEPQTKTIKKLYLSGMISMKHNIDIRYDVICRQLLAMCRLHLQVPRVKSRAWCGNVLAPQERLVLQVGGCQQHILFLILLAFTLACILFKIHSGKIKRFAQQVL